MDVDLSGAATRHGPVSAMLQTPTAVTLASFGVQAAEPAQDVLPWLALLGLLLISRLARARRSVDLK